MDFIRNVFRSRDPMRQLVRHEMGSTYSAAHIVAFTLSGPIILGAAVVTAHREAAARERDLLAAAASLTTTSRFWIDPNEAETAEIEALTRELYEDRCQPSKGGCPGLALAYCIDALRRAFVVCCLSDGLRSTAVAMCRRPFIAGVSIRGGGTEQAIIVVIDVLLARDKFGRSQLAAVEHFFIDRFYQMSGLRSTRPDINHCLFQLDVTSDKAISAYEKQGYTKMKAAVGYDAHYTPMGKLMVIDHRE